MTKDRILVYALRCAVKSSSFSAIFVTLYKPPALSLCLYWKATSPCTITVLILESCKPLHYHCAYIGKLQEKSLQITTRA
jgi:hypothetical protein